MTPSTRRLAAIMAADVAGFSAAMERDEEGTFARVQELRQKTIEPKIAEHTGQLVKTTGDGFLAEFASPIAAMRCALAIQAELADNPLKLRIGLNLGDVIVEANGDVYGEGVNVAARLEGLADPGGILISAKVHSEVEGKVEAAFEDRGEQQVKNIARPVRSYAAHIASGGATTSSAIADVRPLPLPDKPSIAVLPFQNMSGDPEQEYFADGMVEDIITALSRFKSLFVIARNSSFTYKGKSPDIRQVGRELGVRYVLEGSVRKAGGRVRITGQLIEAATNAHLWAGKFDGSLEDIFELQDEVASKVVGTIMPKLELAEMERSKRKPTENLSAYDCYLRGFELLLRLDAKASNLAAQHFLEQAVELDPQFASAYAMLARASSQRRVNRWSDDDERDLASGELFATKAVALGSDDPVALSAAANFVGFSLRNPGRAMNLVEQALALNSNYFAALNNRGWICIWGGEHREGIEQLEKVMRLNPIDPMVHATEAGMAFAYLFLGDLEQAALWSAKALARRPNYIPGLRPAFLAHVLAGNLDEARKMKARVPEIVPVQRISELDAFLPFRRAQDMATFADALRKIGLPE